LGKFCFEVADEINDGEQQMRTAQSAEVGSSIWLERCLLQFGLPL
jgi:hypothetical protein